MKMWMKMFTAMFGDGGREHAWSVQADLRGEYLDWTTGSVSRGRALWYWVVAYHEVWCRVNWRPWVCAMFDHVWEHEESDSAEVGFWCESWCARCGHSSGRRWM